MTVINVRRTMRSPSEMNNTLTGLIRLEGFPECPEIKEPFVYLGYAVFDIRETNAIGVSTKTLYHITLR
jgi:hypothetical protein